jgi:hypothetical protein
MVEGEKRYGWSGTEMFEGEERWLKGREMVEREERWLMGKRDG